MEKYREGQKELHCVFMDLEKPYDTVPRNELWYCLRKVKVAEKYLNVIQDMYEGRTTTVKYATRSTNWFNVKVGLYQESLKFIRFAINVDRWTEQLREESPWTMMLADDILICGKSKKRWK